MRRVHTLLRLRLNRGLKSLRWDDESSPAADNVSQCVAGHALSRRYDHGRTSCFAWQKPCRFPPGMQRFRGHTKWSERSKRLDPIEARVTPDALCWGNTLRGQPKHLTTNHSPVSNICDPCVSIHSSTGPDQSLRRRFHYSSIGA